MATPLWKVSLSLSAFIFFALFASIGAAHSSGPTHPLPPALSIENRASRIYPRQSDDLIRAGGWLVSYRQSSGQTYDGTLRVENNNTHLIVSGDLYERSSVPVPAGGIPIFPRDAHYSYIRVTGYSQQSSAFNLNMQLWLSQGRNASNKVPLWQDPGNVVYSASMVRTTAPGGFPSTNDYFEGDMKNQAGSVTGRFTMGWIHQMFRKFTVEIDTVPDKEVPLNNGQGEDWKSAFAKVGYEVTVDVSDRNVVKGNTNRFWTGPEMHQAMLTYRKPVDFDSEWRIHLLVIGRINNNPRGAMYDSTSNDANNTPREGAVIAADWIVGTKNNEGVPDGLDWGPDQRKRFGLATGPYFRAAVHEVAHALGQYHPVDVPHLRPEFGQCPFDYGYMTTSEQIATCGTEAKRAGTGPGFPDIIKWDFHETQKLWLRHLSDQHVRPGYAEFEGLDYFTTPANPGNLAGRGLAMEYFGNEGFC